MSRSPYWICSDSVWERKGKAIFLKGRSGWASVCVFALIGVWLCTDAWGSERSAAWGADRGAADRPQKIVSLNLCADQYLIALADRSQIAGLSHFARDPALSFTARTAADWPVTKGRAEDLVELEPDLIITSGIRRPAIRAFLETRNVDVVEISPARSLDEIRAQTRLIGKAIGQQSKAEALIHDMVARLGSHPAPNGLRAVHYQPRGFLSGQDTLVSEVMSWAGLKNASGEAGVARIARLSVESLILLEPDILITNARSAEAKDRGSELLRHPALRALFPDERWLRLPDPLLICGGPSFPHAVEALRRQLKMLAPAGP
ncbi:MAG: ABC transporter substrate-binding protein [Pseudomonadota bacterium]